jgi:hypothetical protein
MPIQGKKKYMVYLDEENTELLKSYIESTRGEGGFSALIDEYVKYLAGTLRAADMGKGKVTWAKVFKMGIEGLKRL